MSLPNDSIRERGRSLYALFFLISLLTLSVLLEGCDDSCKITRSYTYYEPVYTPIQEIRTSIQLESPQKITSVGKIYIKDTWLFVNQPGKGIHIIDNQNPDNPVVKSFLKIHGNYDLAVKGNHLYVDSYIDLVVMDISNIEKIIEVKRLENVFAKYNTFGFYWNEEKGVITDWTKKEDVQIEKTDCEITMQPWGGFYYAEGIALTTGANLDRSAAIAPGNGSGPGVGGSMARFTISQNHLYTLDGGDVQTINIASGANPVIEGRTTIAWDMETIFPYKQNLFIGSRTGMHILDISNPSLPVKVSKYEHVRVCDPVVVDDTLAFVTLRSGTQCTGFTNQLEVINIKNLQSPQLIKTYPMTNPHGLGIDQSTLFICDGADGLKIYDAQDVQSIDKNQLAHYSKIHAYDVIPFNDLLIMIGEDGIFQYDYTDPKMIKFLSKLDVADEN
jgi:hypothetical protein